MFMFMLGAALIFGGIGFAAFRAIEEPFRRSKVELAKKEAASAARIAAREAVALERINVAMAALVAMQNDGPRAVMPPPTPELPQLPVAPAVEAAGVPEMVPGGYEPAPPEFEDEHVCR